MANHKSALKKAKQDIVRRDRNRSGKSTLRTALKKYRSDLAAGTDCTAALPGILSLIDRSARHGFLHRNVANRLKSQLTRHTLNPAS